MTDERQSSLIEKIKKLFEMANRKTNNDGSSNEAEAAAAMARAQELLTKYNLDMRTIEDTPAKTGGATHRAGGERQKAQVKRSAMYKWQQEFWKRLAEANFCFHWVQKVVEFRWGKNRKVKRHVILGSAANVIAVEMMGEYLTETIERLVAQVYPKSECLSKAAISWREGCAERLIERIIEKKEEMKRQGFTSEGVTCTAIAVQDVEKKEYAANYDAKWGEGAYARALKRQAEWEAGRAEREKRYREDEALLAELRKNETESERKRREEKERREQERAWRRYQREQEREAARLDPHAYSAGRTKANDINLDAQLKQK